MGLTMSLKLGKKFHVKKLELSKNCMFMEVKSKVSPPLLPAHCSLMHCYIGQIAPAIVSWLQLLRFDSGGGGVSSCGRISDNIEKCISLETHPGTIIVGSVLPGCDMWRQRILATCDYA